MGTPLGALPDVTPAKEGIRLLAILLVAPLALDVLALGQGRLPAGAGTEASFKMKYCHASRTLYFLLSTPFHKVKRK